MGTYFDNIDRFAVALTRVVIRHRWLVILAVILAALGIGSGAQKLEFANNYRVFFSQENPELQAFEDLQATYTKNDNFLFVLEPDDGNAFSRDTLKAVEKLTREAWQIPFAIRVDSVSNFQHTLGIEDDLVVEDLVVDAGTQRTAVTQSTGHIERCCDRDQRGAAISREKPLRGTRGDCQGAGNPNADSL
jgi:hypothetical protein